MIPLSSRLPDCVEVNGKRYKLRTEFFRVLQCFQILRAPDLLPEDQISLCLRALLWRVPFRRKRQAEVFRAVLEQYIAPDKRKGKTKSMDLEHDSDYIYAAFAQAYGINLTTSSMHWWEFRALLSALPDDTKMSQIVSIRTRPMPKPTKYNGEQRAALARAKAEWAVYKTPEEKERDVQEGWRKMALAMQSMAKKR